MLDERASGREDHERGSDAATPSVDATQSLDDGICTPQVARRAAPTDDTLSARLRKDLERGGLDASWVERQKGGGATRFLVLPGTKVTLV